MKNFFDSAKEPRVLSLVFVGIAILVHAGVYYETSRRSTSDIWIYSTKEGVPARTNRQTGLIEFAGTKGWHEFGK